MSTVLETTFSALDPLSTRTCVGKVARTAFQEMLSPPQDGKKTAAGLEVGSVGSVLSGNIHPSSPICPLSTLSARIARWNRGVSERKKMGGSKEAAFCESLLEVSRMSILSTKTSRMGVT